MPLLEFLKLDCAMHYLDRIGPATRGGVEMSLTLVIA
jgi:hypothetical protein